MGNPGEYRKGRIRASIGEKVGFGRVPKMGNLGEYQRGGIRVSIEKVEIQASTENGESG